jgi:hypothetical protein
MDADDLRSSLRAHDGSRMQVSEMRKQHLGQFHSALRQLPDHEKCEVFEALRRSPGLVESESNPVKFLRRESFDANAAAKRLAAYWRHRKAAFGDLAFLPMTIDGGGAMENNDIIAFCRGYVMPLPPDSYGRSGVFVDIAKLRRIPHNILLRCFFYTLHITAENQKSITEGFVGISLFTELKFEDNLKKIAAVLYEAFPVEVYRNHVFCGMDDRSHNAFFARYAAQIVCYIGLDGFRKTVLYATSSREECKSKLLALQFPEGAIPRGLGGSYAIRSGLVPEACTSRAGTNHLQETHERFRPASSFNRGNADLEIGWRKQQLRGATLPSRPVAPATQLPRRFVFEQNFQLSNFVPDRHIGQGSDYALMSSAGPQLLVRDIPSRRLVREDSASRKDDIHIDEYVRRGFECPPDISETEALRQAARMAVDEALLMLPFSFKAAYLEALHVAPRLVESESNAMRFVRVEQYDSRAAARRLANYWSLRKELFEEKAFLPMTQSGYGALTKEDVVVLSCGEVALVPNDDQGRSVVASDRNRMLGRIEDRHLARLRIIFYLLSTLSENESNQKEGVVWLDVLVSPRLTDVSQADTEKTVQVMNAMPCRIKAAHLIMCPPKTGKQRAVELSLAINAMQAGLGKRVIVHTGGSASEIVAKLQPFGLVEGNLPPVMGGSWKYEEFARWQRQRTQLENSAVRLVGMPARDSWDTTSPSVTDKKERKRMLNVIHSRQKRERRRAEAGHLQQQCKSLEEQNDLMKQENTRLQELLDRALALVSHLKQPDDEDAPMT